MTPVLIVAVLSAVVVLIILVQPGGQNPDQSGHRTAEQEYPDEPGQALPPRNPEHQDTSAVPPGEPVAAGSIADMADPDWVLQAAEATGIPERALEAYAGAALRAQETHPGCGIGWNTLAGIGRVESHHGRYGGSEIGANGVVEPAIIGIALDGSPGVMEIPDTDGGELDGDTEYDRAVGPMQFIPSTWRLYAQDGNRDGERNPQQYDDAALTAAAYLCQRGGDLRSDEGWVQAVLAYNQSAEYVNEVAGFAAEYAELTAESD
ncbi:lytic transglycosylase domain-containing protein [Nesterenkonia rhizosphaerae]|uniref:Transglycosylase SLT domain-containing protein n=1 Tax=Nesterenkonia rhizosphaerae TaxID=1348272 RepID=A0ABP9FXV8_9MICC